MLIDQMAGTIEVPIIPELANLFPQAPRTPAGIVLPHRPDTTVLMRNLGIEIPSPVLHHYHFPHPPNKPPFDAQKETVRLLTENTRAYVLSTMGTGKTAAAIWAFDYLRRLGVVRKMIVFAPLSSLNFTWAAHLFEFCPHLTYRVLHGSAEKRRNRLAEDVDVYIINHDGYGVIGKELMARTDIDVLCIDELAVYRNTSDLSKWMKKYAATKIWVWGMTGSPAPHHPTDVWMQAQIVTPWTVPKYFVRFREEVMFRVSQFKWVPRANAAEQAYKVLQPSVRFVLEDVTELPPYISRRIDVDLGTKQKQVYHELRQHCFALVEGQQVSAANAGVVLNKLLQVSLGYVYTKQGGMVELDNHNRIRALIDCINSAQGKVIIFTMFKHSLDGIHKAILDAGFTCEKMSGDTSVRHRDVIFNAFQNHEDPKTLAAHPECMMHSITLTAADTVIWFGPITDTDIYDQANARVRRTGQKRKQQFLHIQATPAEKHIYSLIIGHKRVQDQLLDLLRE